MFSSRRAKLSNGDIGTGQSLFDFLKRKKKVSLEDSIGKSRKQQIDLSFSILDMKQQQQQLNQLQTARTTTHRKNVSERITPKKVTFVDSEQKKQTARTFIDMISPLKSKNSKNFIQSQSKEENSQEEEKDHREISSKKHNTSHHNSTQKQFTRKQLNKSINIMKQTVLKLIKVGKNIKQKSHSLFVDIKPVLKIAQQNQNKTIKRKVEDAKQKLRVMEFQFSQLDVDNANQIMQAFHKNLSDHLISLQAKNKATFSKSEMQSTNKLRAEKDAKINELSKINKDLQHKINTQQRKIQKLQLSLEELKNKQEEKFLTYQESNQQKLNRVSENCAQLQENNAELMQRIKELQKQNKQKDKKIRDLQHTKQTMERKFMEKSDQQRTAKEQFLLNEIMILKKQFQSDMSQLTALYAAKQNDQNHLIEEQRRQIKQLKQFVESNKQNEKRTVSDSELLKNVANKYRKQNECLVSDMHRMNQELYQHWLALKDIKTLAIRLQILPKFARIYQDLAFNDLLFS